MLSPPNLILIFGPPAVGKMTVGQALARQTGYKLFHNHMSLELVNQFFDWSTPPFKQLDTDIRFAIFKAVAQSELPGLIFTLLWAFNEPGDWRYVAAIEEVFHAAGGKVSFVELKAELSERLQRNRHENRLAHKPSKRDLPFSEKLLLGDEERFRMHTLPGELGDRALLRIDNTHLSPEAVADRIIRHFELSKAEGEA